MPVAKNDAFVLQWDYQPTDYFEAGCDIETGAYSMTIRAGKIEAYVDPSAYSDLQAAIAQLNEELDNRFRGAMLERQRAFNLSGPTASRTHPDGRKDQFVLASTASLSATAPGFDVLMKNTDGTIISDSKQDRIDSEKSYSEMASKYAPLDPTANAILGSFGQALQDPADELVHLFEIRDALWKRFDQNEGEAKSRLGISSTTWSRLGNLANNEPLLEGRHRGRKVGELRNATNKELKEARSIARELIEAYFNYLERAADC